MVWGAFRHRGRLCFRPRCRSSVLRSGTETELTSCVRLGTETDFSSSVPSAPESFERTLRRAHSTYARLFNKKHGFSGYLWQDRFFSCPLDEAHTWAALRYVEQNPVRAGMIDKAEDYPWSSAAARCRGERNPLLSSILAETRAPSEWLSWLAIASDTSFEEQIRASTASGIPCGGEDFVRGIEDQVGRVLRLQKPGPKPEI